MIRFDQPQQNPTQKPPQNTIQPGTMGGSPPGTPTARPFSFGGGAADSNLPRNNDFPGGFAYSTAGAQDPTAPQGGGTSGFPSAYPSGSLVDRPPSFGGAGRPDQTAGRQAAVNQLRGGMTSGSMTSGPQAPDKAGSSSGGAFPDVNLAMGGGQTPQRFGSNFSEVGPGVTTDGQYNYQPRFGSYRTNPDTMQSEPVGPQLGWDRTPGGRSTRAGDTIGELDMDGNQTGERSEYRNTLAGDLAKFGLMATGINAAGNFLTGATGIGGAGGAAAQGTGSTASTAGAGAGSGGSGTITGGTGFTGYGGSTYGSMTGLGTGGTGAGLSTTPAMSAAITPAGLGGGAAAAGSIGAGSAAASGGGGLMDTARQVGSAIKTGVDAVGGIGRVAGAIGGAAIANRGAGEVGTSGEFTQAADQQGAENFRTNEYNLSRNRFDTNTPIGSTTWTRVADPNAPGGFRDVQNTNMSPEERSIYDTRVSNQNQAGAMAGDLAGQMRSTFQQPFSLDGIPGTERAAGFQGPIATPQGPAAAQMGAAPRLDRMSPGSSNPSSPEMLGNADSLARMDMSGAQGPTFDRAQREGLPQARDLYGQQGYESSRNKAEQAVHDRISRLMDPQLQRAEAAMDTQLRNQGLMPGTEGYDNAMNDLRQTQAMQRADAIDRSIIAGGDEQSRLAEIDLRADNQRFSQQNTRYKNMFEELGYNNDLSDLESQTKWDRTLEGTEFNRDSQQGDFDNLREALTSRNTARRNYDTDRFGREKDSLDINNRAAQDEFGMDYDRTSFNADEGDRAFKRNMDSFETGYRTAFDLGSDQRDVAGFNNKVRSQDIDERILPRDQMRTEFTDLAGFGRDAQMPNAPPAGVSNLRPTDYQGAADSNYNRNVDNRNAKTTRDQQFLNFFSELFGWN